MRVVADQQVPRVTLERWHADHHNFSRVLDVVERQVDAFRAGKQPDFELLRSIVYYLRHYPGRFHHPPEDISVRTDFVERDPQLQLDIARRVQEHAVIAAAGEELLGYLDRIIAGAMLERAALEKAAATYLVYYRYHLYVEERQVLPRAAELLTATDWAAVAAIPTEPDPLFAGVRIRATVNCVGRSSLRRTINYSRARQTTVRRSRRAAMTVSSVAANPSRSGAAGRR